MLLAAPRVARCLAVPTLMARLSRLVFILIAANVSAPDLPSLQAMGDALREQMESGVGVLAASFDNGKNTMLAVVSDNLRDRGVSADTIVRELAAAAGGKGGGKPHMAQAGIPDAARMATVVAEAPEMIRKHLAATK